MQKRFDDKAHNKEISERLYHLFQDLRLSTGKTTRSLQNEFAGEMTNDLPFAVQWSTVKAHCSGQNESVINYSCLEWYAKKFNVSIDYLVCGTENQKNENKMTGETKSGELYKLMDEMDARTAIKGLAQFLILCRRFNVIIGDGGENSEIGDVSIRLNDDTNDFWSDESFWCWYHVLDQINHVRNISGISNSDKLALIEKASEYSIFDWNTTADKLDERGNLLNKETNRPGTHY